LVGFDIDEHVRAAGDLHRADWWLPGPSNTTGEVIDGLESTKITDLPRPAA
jgi:hypothetical protein